MPSNPILVPDHEAWRSHPHYQPIAAGRLTCAYRLMASGQSDPTAYADALDVLRPCLHLRLMPYQRLSLFYALGFCSSILTAYNEAEYWLTEAIELAHTLDESQAMVDLLTLRGAVYRASSQFLDASDDYAFALEFLDEPSTGEGDRQANSPLRLHLLTAKAIFDFSLARYDLAQSQIAQGRALAPFVPHADGDLATLDWCDALLDRWRGEPRLALQKAFRAVGAVKVRGNPYSLVRLCSVVADAALDIEDSLPRDGSLAERDDLFKLAGAFTTEALETARSINDISGEGLSLITQTRFDCARNANIDAIRTLTSVITAAHQVADLGVVGQAQTVLGRELLARNETDAALTVFRNALTVFEEVETPALGVWARRALLRASEMCTD